MIIEKPGCNSVAPNFDEKADEKAKEINVRREWLRLAGTASAGEPKGPETKYDFGKLHSEKDILRLARDRENGAVLAYGTLASNLLTKAVLNFGANVLVDEVRHRTILNAALGIPNY